MSLHFPEVWEKGGEGGIELANKVLLTLEQKESHFKPLYPDDMSLEDKIATVAREIYGADGVTYSAGCQKGTEENCRYGNVILPGLHGKDTVFSFG